MAALPSENIKNILVVNLGGIGDILLSSPALKALRRLYPESRISVLTVLRSQELAITLSNFVDEVIVFKGILAFIFGKRRTFDLVINMRTLASMQGALKMACLFNFIKAKYKAGRDTEGRGFFLDIKLPEKTHATMHDVDYNLMLVGLLGANTKDRNIEIKIQAEDRSYIEEFLRQNGIEKNDVLIGINPAATWQTKRWAAENFAEVTNYFAQNKNFKIVITGREQDAPLTKRLIQLSRFKIINATGETNTGQLCALIDKCSLYITNDGGSMHIASILKKPLVTIFGPTDPVRFGLYEPYAHGIVLSKKVECSPCFRKRCRQLECLNSIKPQEVIFIAEGLLHETIGKNSK